MLERPAGAGELAVLLTVSGANIEPAAFGAQLVLEKSLALFFHEMRIDEWKAMTTNSQKTGDDEGGRAPSLFSPAARHAFN